MNDRRPPCKRAHPALVEPQEHEGPQKDILRTQLKEAVNEDDSVIPVVNLLQNVLEEDDNDVPRSGSCRDAAERRGRRFE